MDRITPVSYTHLDVYKRQHMYRFVKMTNPVIPSLGSPPSKAISMTCVPPKTPNKSIILKDAGQVDTGN